MHHRRRVIDHDGKWMRHWDDVPRVCTSMEGWEMEALTRRNPELRISDILARMKDPPKPNALTNLMMRFRKKSWNISCKNVNPFSSLCYPRDQTTLQYILLISTSATILSTLLPWLCIYPLCSLVWKVANFTLLIGGTERGGSEPIDRYIFSNLPQKCINARSTANHRDMTKEEVDYMEDFVARVKLASKGAKAAEDARKAANEENGDSQES